MTGEISTISAAELTDEELMSLISAAEDPASADWAFDQVYSRYHQRVVAWCCRVTKNQETAQDLAQEVFLKAFRHSGSFRGDSRLSTWLYSIARNHCLSAIKRNPEETVPLDANAQRTLICKGSGQPGESAERTELSRLLLGLMNRTLEPLEVRVMTLHYAYEMPLASITRYLALTNPSGAKAYIVSARRKLNVVARRRGWKVALGEPAPYWRARAAA